MIRILVAEDTPILCRALVALLSLEPDFEVVGEVQRGDEILPRALLTRPDVAVVDIDLPGIDGLSAAELLFRHLPACQVLVLTGLSQPGNLLRALRSHVRGYVLKDAPAETLILGIRAVAAGRRVIDPEQVAAAMETGANPLTDREADVLRAAADGLSTVDIANRLFLSPATVRNYLSHAVAKLGARNRIDALRIARDAGWL